MKGIRVRTGWTLYKPFAADTRHGTTNAYRNYGCRCTPCSQAAVEDMFERKRARRRRGLTRDDPRHGTENGYSNWGCRCRSCTDAWTVAASARASRRAAS